MSWQEVYTVYPFLCHTVVWIFLKKVLVVLVMLVDSVSSVVLVITFHVIRSLCL